jgi:DNA-binding Xre family transcriptional regulator
MKLDARERNAILAGLRLLQRHLLLSRGIEPDIMDILTDGTDGAINVSDIDALCAAVNAPAVDDERTGVSLEDAVTDTAIAHQTLRDLYAGCDDSVLLLLLEDLMEDAGELHVRVNRVVAACGERTQQDPDYARNVKLTSATEECLDAAEKLNDIETGLRYSGAHAYADGSAVDRAWKRLRKAIDAVKEAM